MTSLNHPTISIIIPTLNEGDNIGHLMSHLRDSSQPDNIAEILVVDGGSQDDTVARAGSSGVRVIASDRGRAVQMNTGAAAATGEVLYFLHADTLPPADFDECILSAYHAGYVAGCFRHSFDYDHRVLRFVSWLVNAAPRLCFGDQSLFIAKSAFREMGGFDESLIIMEDADFTIKLRKRYSFKLVDCTVVTSGRKFRDNGEVRLFFIFFVIYVLYEFGVSQKTLLRIYKSLIRQDKI